MLQRSLTFLRLPCVVLLNNESPGKAPAVEAALVKWIDNARPCNTPLSGPLVKEKAEALAARRRRMKKRRPLSHPELR